jgi:hypothetical protein
MATLRDIKEMIEDAILEHGEDILDQTVMAEYDYGDRGRTRALTHIADLEFIRPRRTAYSDTGWCIPDEDEEESNEEQIAVFVSR